MIKSFVYTLDSTVKPTTEILKNYIYSSLNKTNKRLVTQLAINCLILSIDKEEFHNCVFLIAEITKLLDNELNYYEQTVFLYAEGYFELKKNLWCRENETGYPSL